MHCLRSPSTRRQFLRLASQRSPRDSIAASARWKSDSPEDKLQQQLIYPTPTTMQHSDLNSFQSYATRTGLDEKSTVYVGTHYEYTVAAHLTKYGFDLRRIGGARDRGTDLVGTWTLPAATAPGTTPSSSSSSSPPLKVLVQCKAGSGQRVGPQHMRELEGAFAGAPPGWRGNDSGVLAVMVCERPATKGVREALGHSRWPMAFVYCEGSNGGAVQQMLWNKKAEEHGLSGVGVGMRHVGERTELVLLRKGKMLPFVSD